MSLKVIFNPFTAKFDYIDVTDTSAFASAVPLEIVSGSTYTVPANSQEDYNIPFINNGTILNNGHLVYVRSA